MNTHIIKAGKFALDTFTYAITSIFILSLFLKINLYNSLGNLFLITIAVSSGAFIGEYRRSKKQNNFLKSKS